MAQGNIIVLNGTSSSGKTTIARALQSMMNESYMITGLDHFLERLSPWFVVATDGGSAGAASGFSVVLGPDGKMSRLDIGPDGFAFVAATYRAMRELAAAGVSLIVDDIIYDPRVLKSAVSILHESRPLFVGLHCPLGVALEREGSRDDRRIGGAAVFADLVHAHGRYDVELDTSTLDAEECAARIKDAVRGRLPRTAFRRLHVGV
jgi:chloramphenicol 3-O phosphotransferase